MTEEDFKQLIPKYEKLVFTICYQMTRDYHKAQDLTQETFLSAYTHINRCEDENIRPWLGRIATNKAKDCLKSAYMRSVQLEAEVDEGKLLDFKSSPDELYLKKETLEEIRRKVYHLKEPYLKVSVLYFVEEKSPEEIAKRLDRPLKTVQTQIYRAKVILQNALKEGAKVNGSF